MCILYTSSYAVLCILHFISYAYYTVSQKNVTLFIPVITYSDVVQSSKFFETQCRPIGLILYAL